MPEFKAFDKIPRLKRECIISEKIDGTNAQVHITDDGEMCVGSRNRWLTEHEDNFGFCRWANENKQELLKLGPGTHYGEWWGLGIHRGYGLKEKRFSLFNLDRWKPAMEARDAGHPEAFPSCVGVVPILYKGPFDSRLVDDTVDELSKFGSHAAPSFMAPEGVVIYLYASRELYKVTCKNDEAPKGKVENA